MTIPNSNAALDIKSHLHPQTNLRLHEAVGPLVIEKGDGIHVVDDSGQRYIEGMSGLWCASLGFSNKRLADAAHAQLLKLPYQQTFAHRSNLPVIALAEALLAKAPAPMSKVMFQSSGSEAIDTAIKFVWYYHEAIGKPERRKVIARTRAYHGTTAAAASLTGLPNMHKGFGLPFPGFLQTSNPHYYRGAQPGESEAAFSARLARELEELILSEGPETIGGFFAEPVMGTGGVIVPPEGYFDHVQPILRKYDILFIADEVICGFGRTGHYWGSQAFGLEPDMVVCAKGLSAAYFPMSALMVNDRVYQALADRTAELGGFGQGFTYGGHPVGAAVALETMKIYDEMDVVARVRSVQDVLQNGVRALADHPLVGEARGIGLMAALEFVADKETKAPFAKPGRVGTRVSEELRARGVLLRALGDTLVFAPPLISTEAELKTIVDAVAASLDVVAAEGAGA